MEADRKLDIVVFGRRGGLAMAEYANSNPLPDIPDEPAKHVEDWLAGLYEGGGPEFAANIRSRLQSVMMDNASVVRTDESLGEALDEITQLRKRYDECRVRDRSKVYNTEITEHIELGYLIDMAEALVVSARARTESRGGHNREDHPQREDEHWLKHSFITKKSDGEVELNYKDVTMGRYVPVERKY